MLKAASKEKRIPVTPPDKEGCKIVLVGKRCYIAGALGIKMMNYIVRMARSDYAIWEGHHGCLGGSA